MKQLIFNKQWINTIENRFKLFPQNSLQFMDGKFEDTSRRQAAVLISLCNRFDEASVLFTVRSTKVSTHKGQVSFPGGHLNIDETPVEAAIRETYEELGNNIGPVLVLGQCQKIPSITGTLVTPILGYFEFDVGNFENFQPSEDEVAKVFTIPIYKLLDPTFRNIEYYTRSGIEVEMPYFGIKSDSECVWGFTGKVLDVVIEEVLKPTVPGVQNT
jgi:8-oxo-dGTP pyrophosphatase MutT (NUDIX family)